MKKVLLLFFVIFIATISLLLSGVFDDTTTISVDKNCKIYFSNSRPVISDLKIIACIPAAYTGENGIIGHYSVGRGRQGISDFRYTTINLDQNTHFQQASLVKANKPKSFSDRKRRYRRALCKKDGKYFIVHSKWPVILDEFAKQLTEYERAWNLDMGTYSYGWYKDDNGKLHHLGLSSFWNKEKQSNWIVVRRD